MPIESLAQITGNLFPELTTALTDSNKVTSPRSVNRAHAWKQELARAHAYMLGQAQSPAEEEAVDQLYVAALEDGPDFTRYRTGSTFSEAPKLGIDRNAYARIVFALDLIERGTYRHCRAKGKHGLPRTAARVLKALLGLALRYGRVRPSLDGLAGLACVCKQTVVNCLKVLQFYGFVVVHRRIKRVRTPLGMKVVQDTNAYTVQEPVGLGALGVALFKRTSESKKSAASSSQIHTERRERQFSPPWGVPDGVYDTLRAAWEISG